MKIKRVELHSVSRVLAVTLFGLMLCPDISLAQNDNSFAFEGHVFDKQTLRPVAGAIVQLTEAFDDGTSRSVAVQTDSSGFYSLEMEQYLTPPNKTGHAIFATCLTRKGRTDTGGLTYLNLRSDLYRRDFYIPVPSGQRCDPLLPQTLPQ